MLRVLYGKEPYRIDKVIEESKKMISMQEINISYYENLSSEVQSLCFTYPLLDSSRLVIVSVDALTEEIMSYKTIPEFTNLIILPKTVDKRKELYKKLEKEGFLEVYDKLTEKQLKIFILRFLKTNGGKITESAFCFLVERSGYLEEEQVDLYTIEIYLQQLLLLSDTITKEGIEQVIPLTCREEVYELSKMLMIGNMEQVISLSMEFLERGESPIALLSLLLRSFRLGYKVSLFDFSEQQEVCSKIGISMYQIKGMKQYPKEIWNGAMDIIQEGMLGIKEGGGNARFLLTISKLVFLLQSK